MASLPFYDPLRFASRSAPAPRRRPGGAEAPPTPGRGVQRWSRLRAASLLILATLAITPAAGRADNATLVPVADTTLLESAPDNNMGGWYHFTSGTSGSQSQASRNRAVLRFDPAAVIPAGAKITNAVLTLTVVRIPGTAGGGGPVDSTFDLHRLLRPWGEGNKLGDRGFPADPGEASWNCRFEPDQTWSSPGASAPVDFVAAVSAQTPVTGKRTYTFGPTPALLADAQAWLDHPSTNFGWILISENEVAEKTARDFASREDTNNTPTLLLAYQPAAPFRIDQLTLQTNGAALRFVQPAGVAYAVEWRADLDLLAWATLTNLPAPPALTNVVVLDPLGPPRRLYRLRR